MQKNNLPHFIDSALLEFENLLLGYIQGAARKLIDTNHPEDKGYNALSLKIGMDISIKLSRYYKAREIGRYKLGSLLEICKAIHKEGKENGRE